MSQFPYEGFRNVASEFAENPDPRVPCILLLDASHSMSGRPIDELNMGLQQYRSELLTDSLAARRVEVALLRFGGDVEVVQDFVTAKVFTPPTLTAAGDTPMAEAVIRGIKCLEDRKKNYRSNGIMIYRPWIFVFTDGSPTDSDHEWALACEAVRRGEAEKKFVFFAVGIGDADFGKLKELSPNRAPSKMNGIKFKEFFRWLSASQSRVSASQVGTAIALPPTTGPGGWSEVPT